MIRFFLEYENLVVQLPVNPEELSVTIPGNNKTTEVVKLGEINLIRNTRLSGIQIESFFPKTSDAPYVLTKGRFEGPQFYIDFIAKAREGKKPLRLVISGTKINMLVAIEEFEHIIKAQDDDIHYSIVLKEYRPYSVKIVVPKPVVQGTITTATTGTTVTTARVKKGYAIGDSVVVTGKYWSDSYGKGPSGTFTNYTGKISHIVSDTKRKYRYHITTPTGGWRGWVAESQMSTT